MMGILGNGCERERYYVYLIVFYRTTKKFQIDMIII